MTVPLRSRLPASCRRLVLLAAAGVLGLAAPVLTAAPAGAAPEGRGAVSTSGPCRARFGATAASELLALRLLDLRPLAGSLPPGVADHVDHAHVTDVQVATTHAGMAGGSDSPKAAAEARYLRAEPLGRALPASILDAQVYQEAPPPNAQPVTAAPAGADLGAIRLGTGGLSAHATWEDARRCDPEHGPRSVGEASLAGADVLPTGANRALLHVGALQAGTSTRVIARDGRAGASAEARAEVAEFVLFAGSPAAVSAKIVHAPTLRGIAGGSKASSSVTYDAPVVEVTLPGKAPQRLAGAGSHLDVVVPVDTGPAGETGPIEGAPVLSGLPLGQLLSGQPTNPAAESAGTSGHGPVVVVRLALGDLQQEITDAGVHAEAASLRLTAAIRAERSGHSGHSSGYGGNGGSGETTESDTVIADLALCRLEVAAAAPKGGLPYGGGGGSGTGSGSGGTGSGGTGSGGTGSGGVESGGHSGPPAGTGASGRLPLTGSPVAMVIAGGTLLVILGRLLTLLARRRFTG